MMLKEDYYDITGDAFSDMRVLVEGAIVLVENYTGCLGRLATEAGNEEARTALNDVSGALYSLRKYIKRLQVAHVQHIMQSDDRPATINDD